MIFKTATLFLVNWSNFANFNFYIALKFYSKNIFFFTLVTKFNESKDSTTKSSIKNITIKSYNNRILVDIKTFSSELRNTILQSTSDLTSCLLNCSNKGVCKSDYITFVCECFDGFEGKYCTIDLNPCSSHPCLYNGICENLQNRTSSGQNYSCSCPEYYYGKNCELRVDVCQNETCNQNGYCFDNSSIPTCVCDLYYSGYKCEIKSFEYKVIQTVRKSSIILVTLVVTATCIYFLLNDFLTSLKKEKKVINKSDTRKKNDSIRFSYKNKINTSQDLK